VPSNVGGRWINEWVWGNIAMFLIEKPELRREKPVPLARNPTRSNLELNTDLRGGRQVTGRPNHLTVL
jgi:hypothetical protein